jgi:hypothetical protein
VCIEQPDSPSRNYGLLLAIVAGLILLNLLLRED